MKTRLRLWATVALLMLAARPLAQESARIEGMVSVQGRGLQGVAIDIRRGEQTLATASSRPDGSFGLEFEIRDNDSYQLRLQHAAFGTRVLDVGLEQRNARLTEGDLNVIVELRLFPPATSAPPPPPTGSVPTAPPTGGAPSPSGDNHATVKVFYATDRARTAAADVEYGAMRNGGGMLHLGRFDVSVPRDHRMGSLERPTIWTFWREDPAKHFIIRGRVQQSYEEFYREVSGLVAQSQAKAAFVFVHGYNVTFDSAVYRTAQLAYDLGFDGAPILYSWPSEGTEAAYAVDANNSQWTIPHLRWFLEDVSAKTGARVVHLIAHSMGNVPLVHALREIAIAPRSGPRPRFNQIVLTAPDIDLDTFRQLAGAIGGTAERITLYASSGDLALKLSKTYQGYQRAGDSLPQVIVLPGIDTIDVSAVDTSFLGHSYYGDNRSVLADLFGLIKDGLAPSARFGLRETGSPPRRWWIFQP